MHQVEFYEAKLNYETDSWDLYTSIHRGDNIIVVDARSNEAYAQEHIPGAINLPHRQMNEKTVQSLNKDILYVTYCDGIGCNASTKGALQLSKYGFKVKELLGGLDWWSRDGYKTNGKQGSNGHKVHCGC